MLHAPALPISPRVSGSHVAAQDYDSGRPKTLSCYRECMCTVTALFGTTLGLLLEKREDARPAGAGIRRLIERDESSVRNVHLSLSFKAGRPFCVPCARRSGRFIATQARLSREKQPSAHFTLRFSRVLQRFHQLRQLAALPLGRVRFTGREHRGARGKRGGTLIRESVRCSGSQCPECGSRGALLIGSKYQQAKAWFLDEKASRHAGRDRAC